MFDPEAPMGFRRTSGVPPKEALMSVAGILSTAAFSIGSQFFQSRMQKMKQEFQKLGTDLQSGNLTAAQSDFAALQKMQPQPATTPTQSSTTITQDFTQLAADLKPGNTTAAQQDFTKLQQDFQSQATQAHHRPHHHANSSGSSAVSQLFTQLGSALQSVNLTAAQTAYSTMLQTFAQYGQTGRTSSTAGVSVSA
jgi:hypothetical protein